jgi:hypothetical protein
MACGVPKSKQLHYNHGLYNLILILILLLAVPSLLTLPGRLLSPANHANG